MNEILIVEDEERIAAFGKGIADRGFPVEHRILRGRRLA